ncbi:MAG: tetratricopeptide repeat protein [Ferruginibacter sp.]
MNEVQKLIKKISALFEKEKYQEIIELLKDEILDKYANADLYAWRAWAHNRLFETSDAFKYAEKAIKEDPTNYFGYFQRGSAWNSKNEYNKAIEDYNKVIELRSDYAYAYNGRGAAWDEKGEYDKAIQDYDKAIELKNDYAYAYYNRGNSWDNKGEYDKAIQDYSKTIELKSDYAFAYNNRGVSWDNKGEYDKAIQDYSKAIELQKNDSKAFQNRGTSYFSLENFEKAIEDFEKAMELDKKLKYLEYDIKLAKEKLDERKKLKETKANESDKEQKSEIEKRIESIITKIRKLSKSEVQTVVHYTKVSVADIYVKNFGVKMHYSNAIYMNDPMEGRMLFEYFSDQSIEIAYMNGEKRTETSVYLGSFLPAEENDGEISHEDELVMWRTYGKDETGKEAAGCSIVLSSEFFKAPKDSTLKDSTKDLPGELLNVAYIKKTKNRKTITNDNGGKISNELKSLKEELKKFIKLSKKYKPKDDFYREIESTIFKQLSLITYLFKSADYQYEHETRVITYMPRNSDFIKAMDVKDPGKPCKRFCIESHNDILPYIKKIYLGPKVEHYQHWILYLDYEIRQRAKELEAKTPPPYKINPSDIEIIKSENKFQ